MMPHPLADRLRAAKPSVSVGVLTADWMSLGAQISLLESAGVGLLHFDVMDGRFCPALTFGSPIVAAVKTSMLKDVHLMIEEPLAQVESFVAAGADIISVQAESTRHLHRVLQCIGRMTNANDPQRGIIRGVALNPGTSLSMVDPVLDEIELVLLLAVNPGWSGQGFIAHTRERLAELRRRVGDRVLICVDGGVTRDNVAHIARIGADLIVTGSAVLDGKAPLENALHMIHALQ